MSSPTPCPDHPRTRSIGARCDQCGTGLQWQIEPSPHPEGSLEHKNHITREKAAVTAHVSAVYGRPLDDNERDRLNNAVTDAISWHVKNSNRDRPRTPPPPPRTSSAQGRPTRPRSNTTKPPSESRTRSTSKGTSKTSPRKTSTSRPRQSADTTRVKGYVRSDGTRVRAHTRSNSAREWAANAWRSATATRIRRTATGTAASGTVCALIIAEAGFTLLSTLGMLLIAGGTTVMVWAGNIAEQNRKGLDGQRTRKRNAARKRRTAQRTGTRKTTRRR